MRVGLFVTCVVDLAYPGVGQATVELLRRLGVEVVFPEGQGCCGQMHVNSGHATMAAPMVRSFVDAFAGCDVVVAPSGSCVGSIRHQYGMVAKMTGDAKLLTDVEEMAPRVRELSEFLVYDLGIEDVGATFEHRVAYHPSCHSLRVARVGDAPLRLLANVRGLELVKQRDREGCCGFGGTFALKNSDTSTAMMVDKLDAFEEVDAEYVTSLDTSCLMHLAGGVAKRGAGAGPPMLHLAEILVRTAKR
jgi:L-lactate dehydrogenase complex protein LldE